MPHVTNHFFSSSKLIEQASQEHVVKKFTLLEALIVIAIIALLITILLPSLTKAREKGRQAVCLSNFKQMNMATFGFTKENKQKLPGPLTWLQSNTYSTYTSSLAGELAPFMGFEQATSTTDTRVNPGFLCPSFTRRTNGSTDQVGAAIYRSGGRGGASFSGKYGYFGHPIGGDSKLIIEVTEPDTEMILFETDNHYGAYSETSHTVRHGIKGGKAIRTTNYIDGHAKLELHRLTRN